MYCIKLKSGALLRKKIRVLMVLGIFSLPLFFMSCSNDDSPSQNETIDSMLSEVRKVTSGLSSKSKAEKAGWKTAISDCVEHPTEGGMGYHIAKMEYMDGRVNHKEPQVLLFASTTDGDELELVGVEYIVPFSILPSTEKAPELFFQKFHKNEAQKIWALHVWTDLENPKGTFYDWNPKVSCK